jgi:hypothetical protein
MDEPAADSSLANRGVLCRGRDVVSAMNPGASGRGTFR